MAATVGGVHKLEMMAEISIVQRPKSVVNHKAALASLLFALLVIAGFKWFASQDAAFCLVSVVIAIAMPHLGIALADWEEQSAKSVLPASNVPRILTKLWGQICLYGVLALSYFVFQGFSKNYLLPLVSFGVRLQLLVIIVTPIYIWFTDRRLVQPEDGLFKFGQLLLFRFRKDDGPAIKQYLLGWAVKGYFGPLMAGFALNDMSWFLDLQLAENFGQVSAFYATFYRMIYFVDVLFAVTGYLCTFRLMNTHIKSTEPTMFGWVICLLCYPPFWPVFSDNFLSYGSDYQWGDWLARSPMIWTIWAAVIMAATTIYTWATVSFGVRFSNLTNRGIITNGPYRWVKHPAYVSKNFSWWFVSMPFLSALSATEALRASMALLLLNGVYYLRAKTEERHLSSDPDYVAYVNWMASHSLYAKIKRLIRKKTLHQEM